MIAALPRPLALRGLPRLGMLAELGWGFVGSLGLGLGARPPVAGLATARLWLVVAIGIALLAGLAAWSALPARQGDAEAGADCR